MTTLAPSFGERHFGTADLGHAMRNRGPVKIADAIHRHPGGTLPHELYLPKDDKAMDRLMNRPEGTHASVLPSHCQRTLDLMRRAEGPVLMLHDTTEWDYTGLRSIADLGSIGSNLGRGYLCHNRLVYDPQKRDVLGLANQILHVRRGDDEKRPLRLGLVVVRDKKPPKGCEPLGWLLLTNVPTTNEPQAWERTKWYECRWVIEEFHKGQKTGCGIEDLQFTSAPALQPMIALLSVVAVTLLNLREAARDKTKADRPATEYVDRRYVEVLAGWRYQKPRPKMTVEEFFLALARLGGHQNRKHDHPPGWIVLWRGWMALQHMLNGAAAIAIKFRGET